MQLFCYADLVLIYAISTCGRIFIRRMQLGRALYCAAMTVFCFRRVAVIFVMLTELATFRLFLTRPADVKYAEFCRHCIQ